MENKKDLLNNKEKEKVSGGTMGSLHANISVSGPFKDKDGSEFSGKAELGGSWATPYCDVCGKAISDEEFTAFMYDGKLVHICEACNKKGFKSIFK